MAEKNWIIWGTLKRDKSVTRVIENNLTEAEAEEFCEAWGWSYQDEQGNDWWIGYQEKA